MRTVCDCGDLPAAERLAYFDECQVHGAEPMRVTAEPAGFRASVRALDLTAVNVAELTCSAADLRRTPKLVRRADPELCSMVLPLRGTVALAQGERSAELGAGDMALVTSSHPYEARLAAGRGTAMLLRVNVPRASLPVPARTFDRLAATPMSGRSGVGAMFAGFLTRLATDAAAYTPADLARMSAVTVDLLAAVLAHHLGAEPSTETQQATLLPRVLAYIRHNLHDPRLSPDSIAAAHHISVSYLHRLFQDHELTVAAWIRRQRLDRAGRDLADAAFDHLPVQHIAARWGFTDHATFTRAFRAAYGVPPRDHRRLARTPARDSGPRDSGPRDSGP